METTKTINFRFSVLLLREGDGWVAQCLEYDLAAQGKTIADAKEAFAKTFAGQIAVDVHHNQEPLATFGPAPRAYWEKFKVAERLVDRQPILGTDCLPAFMINAMADDLRVSA